MKIFQKSLKRNGIMTKNLDVIELPNIHRNRKLPKIAHWAAQISKAMSHLPWFTNTSFSLKYELITVHCVLKDSDDMESMRKYFEEIENFLQSKVPYDLIVVYKNV